jgi:uncharacterized protein (DUF983 family)
MFTGLFHMVKTCPYCGARFERASGDSIGGVYINVALAEFTSMTGFFLSNALFHPPLLLELAFWVTYVLVFCALFYRHGKGLWVGVNYLLGGVYPDPDYEREYIAPKQVLATKKPQRNE